MGLQTAFLNFLNNPTRIIRILVMKFTQVVYLLFSTITFHCLFKNKNVRKPHTGIPQPKYYNVWSDIQAGVTLLKLFYVNDLSKQFRKDSAFEKAYKNYNYDAIVKAYCPTKSSAFESVNIHRTWKNSYWNPINRENEKAYKRSDLLFADMLVNTQGVFKVKKIKHDSIIKEKAVNFFQALLEKNKDKFKEAKGENSIIDSLIDNDNLFYLDYPILRQLEEHDQFIGENGKKYHRVLRTTSGTSVPAYIEIPFAIFAKIPDYAGLNEKRDDFVCLAAVFNETFYKTKYDEIGKDEIYHCFVDNHIERERWQLAKNHMASTDVNDYTIRVHLGYLHFASSIYTTAFYNLSRANKNFKWFFDEFLNVFSWGLLQVNFLANYTLVDYKKPLAERIFYLSFPKSGHLINEQNSKFNIMEFDPDHLGKDSYESDAGIMSRAYYKKLQIYIEYLFEKYQSAWSGRTRQIGELLLRELRDEKGKFDGIPDFIAEDETPDSLKKIMTNLAYLWVVHHGETFSFSSVSNNFYFVPSTMRKPLSELPPSEMSDDEKEEWLLHPEVIKDYLTLQKVVTFRTDSYSIVSSWNSLNINQVIWSRVLQRKTGKNSIAEDSYEDFWNDVTIEHERMNSNRTQDGLYNLHWLMPHELPIALYI